jgi:hypothetical protein
MSIAHQAITLQAYYELGTAHPQLVSYFVDQLPKSLEKMLRFKTSFKNIVRRKEIR